MPVGEDLLDLLNVHDGRVAVSGHFWSLAGASAFAGSRISHGVRFRCRMYGTA